MTRSIAVTFNALGLYAVALVLAAAFAAQLYLGELPCPLCLLQRIEFAMLAIGPMLNVRFGPRSPPLMHLLGRGPLLLVVRPRNERPLAAGLKRDRNPAEIQVGSGD